MENNGVPPTWVKAFTSMIMNQMALSAMVDGKELSIDWTNPALYFAALNTELGELLNHLNWKPWKQARPVHKEETLEEWADCLAFFLINTAFVMEATGATVEEMLAAHVKKTLDNQDRFLGKVDGYGGSAIQK